MAKRDVANAPKLNSVVVLGMGPSAQEFTNSTYSLHHFLTLEIAVFVVSKGLIVFEVA